MSKYLALACVFFTNLAFADLTVDMNTVTTETPDPAGKITISQNKYGVLFTPNLEGLPPGIHGFHVHTNPSCDKKGDAAGGHLDPQHTNKHLGPYDDKGHLGDLPAIYVDKDGYAKTPVLAPRLKLSDLAGHSLMIHVSGDNYDDMPAKLGGGGMRMVCGVITDDAKTSKSK